MKNVLVYPCGTEIGLEVYRSLCFSTHYKLIGGTDSYDHGRFVYHDLIEGLPFIKDDSSEEDIRLFESTIADYDIDFIYPAMDGVIAVFAKYRNLFKETMILPSTDTAEMCRSKRETYRKLKGIISIPKVYNSMEDVHSFPVFIKPDQGQGSVGARRINLGDELKHVDFQKNVVLEYLPGEEFTVDCFTNADGKLIYARGRGRKRIKNGISVNAIFEDNSEFLSMAEKINNVLGQKGGWFFQVKKSNDGSFKLLEVACRIAGTSAISRNIGANLPLMTVDVFNGVQIDDVTLNDCDIELDRALGNVFKTNLKFSTVYLDYDDTVVQNGWINTTTIKFLFQCINKGIKIVLLSKHEGDLRSELEHYRLSALFDEVIHIDREDKKFEYIKDKYSIFIDDSYGERKAIKSAVGIPVFDTHMIECLLEE